MTAQPQKITAIINQIQQGKEGEWSDWLSSELKKLAKRHLTRERAHHTLQATELVNEAYLALFTKESPSWNDRIHFLAYASQVMRHILIQHARTKLAQKRGGEHIRVSLSDFCGAVEPDWDLIALHETIEQLSELDERKAKFIVWRYFGGLTIDEIQELTTLSPATIHLEIKKAKGWIIHRMGSHRGC